MEPVNVSIDGALELKRSNLFILPTRIGWYFALILLALLAIAIKYGNQPAFMMLFILVSVGLIGMLHTHSNLLGLHISDKTTKPVFLGQEAKFPLVLENKTTQSRQAVWLLSGGFHRILDLDSNQTMRIEVAQPTLQRGYLSCPAVTLTSQYPLGLFFCWSRKFQPQSKCLVYPQPIDLSAQLEADHFDQTESDGPSRPAAGTNYRGMRSYQEGDSLRDIHWPSLAKLQRLVTIEHDQPMSKTILLSWFQLPRSWSIEDRLGQLCYWIIELERSGQTYALELPGVIAEANSGEAHFKTCLKTLALWGLDDD